MADDSKKQKIPLIGVLAVKNQLVTKAELEVGLAQCRDAENPELALRDYFIAQELISQQNMQRLILAAKAVSIRQKEYAFGAIALAKGFINKSVLDLALEEQEEDIRNRKKPRLIGDMMVEAGLLTVRQRDHILTLQKRVKRTGPSAGTEGPEPALVSDAAPTQAARGPESLEEGEPTLLEPEMITGGIRLQVSSDFMAAFLTKAEHFNENIVADEIKEALIEKGIVLGLVPDEMIEGFIRSSGFKTQSFRVAKGVRAIQGQDARIEFFFNTDYLKAGGMDGDGNIDFKQRGEIPLVEKGTVLAEKTPRVEGRWGQNIYGDEVATENGQDKVMQFGKGAVLSEDGLKVLAGVRGYPKYSLGGVIFVHEEYTTGDVDYETGHIEFDGNVNVKGCIKAGFKVKGNDVNTVELDGGIVEADGDLKVTGGINEGTIYARGNVYAKFIHNSQIVCMGDVYVQKEIVDSTIETAGSCVITNGKLISSTISAKMGMTAKNIGTETAAPSSIRVGHDAFTEKELAKNKDKVSQLKEEIAGLEQKREEVVEQNNALQREISELAHVQDRAQLEQREVTALIKSAGPAEQEELKNRMAELAANAQKAEQDLDHCFEKSEAYDNLVDKLDRDIAALVAQMELLIAERNNLSSWSKENPGKAMVAVEGVMLSGTQIMGKHSEYTVEKEIRRARVTEILYKTDGDDGGRTIYQMKVGNY